MSGEMNCVSLLPEIATIDLDQIDLFFIESLYYDKEYCVRFLMHMGLLKKDKMCCGRLTSLTEKESVKDGYIFHCYNCSKYYSVRAGSFFERSRLSFSQILKLLYYYSNDITNQDFLIKEIKVTSKTIVDWKNFIRDVYCNYFLNYSSKIGGPHIIVQIDESLICKRKYNVGRILANQD